MIGEIRPNASNEYRFIVVAVDYFSKWVEAESFRNVTAKQMAKFIAQNLICRYGMLHHVVTDNGVQFQAETKATLKYMMGHHKSSPYRCGNTGIRRHNVVLGSGPSESTK